MSSYFHFGLGVVQRSRGGSAQRRSAYQSRTCLTLPDGTVIDYSARGDHVKTLMLAPAEAPDWARDPKEFWRRAAAAETRADAQEARLLELSIPRGLSRADWVDVAHKLALVFVRRGMTVQVDVQCSTASDGEENPHAHFMLSMRELKDGSFAEKKARHWNKLFYGRAAALRKQMTDFLNAYCKRKGVPYDADPRSNEARGLPTAEMSLPRWNILLFERAGKKTPWLEQRDSERAARSNIAALEVECQKLEREIARLQSLGGRETAPFVDIGKRNETNPVRGPTALQRAQAPTKRSRLDQISGEFGQDFRSQPGQSSSNGDIASEATERAGPTWP